MISRRKPTGLHRSKDNWPNSHFFINRQHVETERDTLTNFYTVTKSKLFLLFLTTGRKISTGKEECLKIVMLLPCLFAPLGGWGGK